MSMTIRSRHVGLYFTNAPSACYHSVLTFDLPALGLKSTA